MGNNSLSFRRQLRNNQGSVINGQLKAMGGDGGIIAVDGKGNIAQTFNTPGMYRAMIDANGKLSVSIFKDE